ncbi:hypothetical protein RND81_06G232000 [Saponaria officinalis]|uniref:Exostosin GT47 domain-containing protein n=1 Tax=Saponaria officinalis TaxID=3572 RepID=A0AAW1KE25_SAPOF
MAHRNNHRITTTILRILTTFSLLHQISAVDDPPDSDCTDRWIHIRKLPTKFNTDILTNCSSFFPLYDDFCPYLSNHGLGQKTHTRTHSWYRTDTHMLELIFHRRILEYPCLTADPSLASAVFVPYYASLDALRYLYGPEYNSSQLHGMELYEYLRTHDPEIWDRFYGHDHFLIMARTAWDFTQPVSPATREQSLAKGAAAGSWGDEEGRSWGTSFLVTPEFYNVTALTLESRAWAWQEQAVPHPTSFHPPSLALLESWVLRVRRSRRSVLMLFAGGGGASVSGNPNIRRSIREECGRNNSNVESSGRFQKVCEIVDCSNGVCEHDPIRYMKPMLQASFCLQPPGETPARRSTFDGIIAGCIPVFFEDQSAKMQYKWHLPPAEFDEFSVTIPKEDVVFKGVKVVDVLMGIPRSKVRRMREKVMDMIPKVMYRKHGSSLGLRTKKDAFDIAVEGTLLRIKDRLKQISDADDNLNDVK